MERPTVSLLRVRRNLLDLSLTNIFIVISYREILELKAVLQRPFEETGLNISD